MLNVTSALAMSMQGGGEGAPSNPILSFLPLILMFAVFYFLLIRPQQKRQKQHRELIQSLKKGDRVITSSGILGTISGVKDGSVILKVGDDDIKIEFLKSAVSALQK